jgi:GNAT superfamily N-acetyltransferase
MEVKKIVFEIHPVAEVLTLLIKLDAEIDKSMHLSEEEKKMILNSEGFALLATNHQDEVIAAGYGVSSLEARDILNKVDGRFIPNDNQLYVYSVVVAKAYRRQGLGGFIFKTMLIHAKYVGYKTVAAHVRTIFGLDSKVIQRLAVKKKNVREVKNFWPKLTDPDVRFVSFKL